MTIQQIYDLAIKLGKQADLRDKGAINEKLQREKLKFNRLNAKDKKYFDLEQLTNPYSDTRVLFGKMNAKIKRILTGIDITSGDVLLADRLSEKGKKIDLIVSHHPLGKALAKLDDVMELQVDLLEQLGIPINIAEGLMKIRMSEVSRSVSPVNHNKSVDAAKILNIPIMCTHTIADNLVSKFINDKLNKAKPNYVSDILNILDEIPEYQEAKKINAGPVLFAGSAENRCGKFALTEVTGGTAGSKDIYKRLSELGIGTIIGMHMSEEYKQEAEKNHLNVIIAGHMASDSLGMNLFLDELEKKGVEIIPCSGLIRIKR